ncbi:thiamine pyrophosphate-binding protein [Anaerophaga thermohalophila]|uniref:thiamine pyrophosphate-binding protein n=1 Tax=Anaerophaga thermohalophila TaxID=177400 RepID=UPI000237CDFC|nr:thiamine pyrophosphate-binding protein [Anaerophaga thermohalophila]
MTSYYSDEKNVQIILSLLKKHGIKKVIASPGTKNINLVVSMQNDSFFEMYSSVDERSAAYMACGLAAASGEPVVISCTGATASRNYLSGLTEAYYRKLPVLSITSAQSSSKVGHNIAQIIDRSVLPKDVVKLSVNLPIIRDDEDFWDCEIKVNKAILELKHHGGGPVHINLPTTYNRSFDVKELPSVRNIQRITYFDKFPDLPEGKIAIFIGAHKSFSKEETDSIDNFCASNNAIVFCDHTSSYKGKFRVLYALAAGQQNGNVSFNYPDLIIHIGEVTGDYYSLKMIGKQVWRVSEDGEIKDTFKKLTYVFEMSELYFFEHYSDNNSNNSISYFDSCKKHLDSLYRRIPELAFSNIWIASKMAHQIPRSSTVHFGILNSLRSWNFFELPDSVTSFSNVGGFGIDGNLSALVGASLSDKDKLFFGIFGDLAFFYDMNVIGNRHIGNNLRILLVNNGKGTEFRQFTHIAAQHGEHADEFIAAARHFGNKSKILIKHFSEDLGFEYLSAGNKEEFEQVYKQFLNPEITEKPILFEVFTNSEDESLALKAILNIEESIKGKAKQFAKNVLGDKGTNTLKRVIGK